MANPITIVRKQQDEDDPRIWYAKIAGEHSIDGIIRLANVQLRMPPELWILDYPGDVQLVIDNGTIHEEYNSQRDYEDTAVLVDTQLKWLEDNIHLIDTGSPEEVKVLLTKQLQLELKALGYIFHRGMEHRQLP